MRSFPHRIHITILYINYLLLDNIKVKYSPQLTLVGFFVLFKFI